MFRSPLQAPPWPPPECPHPSRACRIGVCQMLPQPLLTPSLNVLGADPKGLFPSSVGDGGDQARGCLPVVASSCQDRSDSLAMQGSVAPAVSKGTLEHVAVLFAQEQPGAPG